ncbi:hypothetical protein OH77DRAFT_689293 [Trametes cingulata]|nr:hypothetical protein OH77DRAFT_689293 [Trametes cingulata]
MGSWSSCKSSFAAGAWLLQDFDSTPMADTYMNQPVGRELTPRLSPYARSSSMNASVYDPRPLAAPTAEPMQIFVTTLASSKHPAPPNSRTALFAVAIEPPHPPQIGMTVRLRLVHVDILPPTDSRQTPTRRYIHVPAFHFVGTIVGERVRDEHMVVYVVKSDPLQSFGHLRLVFLHLRPEAGAVGPKSLGFAQGLAEQLKEVAYRRRLAEFYGSEPEGARWVGADATWEGAESWSGYASSDTELKLEDTGAPRRHPVPPPPWREVWRARSPP